MRQCFVAAYAKDIRAHPLYYAGWVFLLLVGLFCGYASIKFVSGNDKSTLINSMTQWLHDSVYGETKLYERILPALFTHGRWMLLLVLSGLFRFGIPFVLAVPAVKGFGMGIVTGTLWLMYGFQGLLLAAVVLLLQNLFLIPAFAYTGSVAISHIRLRSSRFKSSQYAQKLAPAFLFFAIALIMGIVVLPPLIGLLARRFV
jgi:stage II sporulation protein M